MFASARVLFTEVMIICVIALLCSHKALCFEKSHFLPAVSQLTKTLHLVAAKLGEEHFCWQRAQIQS